MSVTGWIVAAAVLAGGFALKRLSLVSVDKARRFLQEGAIVVDVRDRTEFNSGQLPGAVNLPLGDLSERAAVVLRNKNQYLLLHCVSGVRSGLAKRQLRQLGYNYVYNLGSYRRAEQIVQAAGKGRSRKGTRQPAPS